MSKLSYLTEDYLIEANEDSFVDSIIREYDADKAFESLSLMECDILNEQSGFKYPAGATTDQKRKIDEERKRRIASGEMKKPTPKEIAEKKREDERSIKQYKETQKKTKPGKKLEPKAIPVKEPKTTIKPMTAPPKGTPKTEPQNPNLVSRIQGKFSTTKTSLLNRMRELRKSFSEAPPGTIKAGIRDKINSVRTQFKNLDLKSKAAGLLNLPKGSQIVAGAIKFAPQIGAGMVAALAIAGAFKIFKNMYNKGGQICASAPNKKACLAKQKLNAAIQTKGALQRAHGAAERTEHPEKGQVRIDKQIRKWDKKIKGLQDKVNKAGG